MTGHGNVVFNATEAENLRNYLIGGGFLHIDDNYGMDPYVRLALEQVFPDLALVELPYGHPIYHQTFEFNNGLPKIHEHDGEAPIGYGIFYENRLVVYLQHPPGPEHRRFGTVSSHLPEHQRARAGSASLPGPN